MEPVDLETLWPAAAILVGLLVGSFANVCIHRIPLGQSILSPRSRCPTCAQSIAAWDNVPVLSWLILGGRCRRCRTPISVRYPLVELTNGLMYGLVAWRHGMSLRSVIEMAFVSAALILALIDLDHRILPNVITLPGILLGVAASLVGGGPTMLESAASAAGAFLIFAAVAKGYERWRGVEGLGQGDWKMAAMMGAVLGWQQTLFAILVGTTVGSVIGLGVIAFFGKDGRYELPLGTFLAVGSIAAVLVGSPALRWYRSLFSV